MANPLFISNVTSIGHLLNSQEVSAKIHGMDQETRMSLIEAVGKLQKPETLSDHELDNINRFLMRSFNPAPRSNVIKTIQNKWNNTWGGRVSSKQVEKEIKSAAPELFYKAWKSLEKENRADGIQYLVEASKLGHREASYELGKLIDEGVVQGRDFKPSSYYYDLAAKKGHEESKIILTLNYAKKPSPKTLRILIDAAEKGNSKAQLALGIHYLNYENPDPIMKNLENRKEKAIKYLKDCIDNVGYAEKEKADANFLLANVYEEQMSKTKDDEEKNSVYGKMLLCLYQAEAKGSTEALIILLGIYKGNQVQHGLIKGARKYLSTRLANKSSIEIHPERFGFEKSQSKFSRYLYQRLGKDLHDAGLISEDTAKQIAQAGKKKGIVRLDPIPISNNNAPLR